jgi:hypothetical protein
MAADMIDKDLCMSIDRKGTAVRSGSGDLRRDCSRTSKTDQDVHEAAPILRRKEDPVDSPGRLERSGKES